MHKAKFSTVGGRIAAAREYVRAGRTYALPHLRWELREVMSRVRPEDLSATEITAILGVLTPAHTRVIGGPASRPPVFVEVRDEHPTPNFA